MAKPIPPKTIASRDLVLARWRQLAEAFELDAGTARDVVPHLIDEIERLRAFPQRVHGGLLAPDAPPLSDADIGKLRERAKAGPLAHWGDPEDTWHSIARLLDAFDLAVAENREFQTTIAKQEAASEMLEAERRRYRDLLQRVRSYAVVDPLGNPAAISAARMLGIERDIDDALEGRPARPDPFGPDPFERQATCRHAFVEKDGIVACLTCGWMPPR